MAEYQPSKLDEEAYSYYVNPPPSDGLEVDLDARKIFHAIRGRAYDKIHKAFESDEDKSQQSLKHVSTLYAGRCSAHLLTERAYDKGLDLYDSDAIELIKQSEPSDSFLEKLRELPGEGDLVEELEEAIRTGKFCGIFPFC